MQIQIQVTKEGFKCNRCNHEWLPRSNKVPLEPPVNCPKCNSPYWNKERKNKVHGSLETGN